MSRQAFGARRVTQQLDAIALYLDEAAQIAGGVLPAQVAALQLKSISTTSSPRIREVLWTDTGTRVMERPDGPESVGLVVLGSRLQEVQRLKLIGAAAGSTFFEADAIEDRSEEKLTARLTLKDPSIGSYHAYVVTRAGQTFLRQDACEIAAPLAESEPGGELQLGALNPSHGADGTVIYAALMVLSGRPTRFAITDVNGRPVSGWSVEMVEKEEFARQVSGFSRIQRLYGASRLIGLRLDLSGTATPTRALRPEDYGLFYLVAESDDPPSEDKLAFFVRPAHAGA